jgi:hypothetical protein
MARLKTIERQRTAAVNVPISTKHTSLVVASGVMIASFFLAIGAGLNSIGRFNSSPFGYAGEFVLAATLGPVLGYDLGLALKNDEPGRDASLFWASFYGTFSALAIAYGLYSALSGGSPLAALGNPSLYPVAILITGLGGFAILIQTELVEPSRRKYVKQALDLFSNKLAAAVLSGYGAGAIFDFGTGVVVGGAVFVGYIALPRVKEALLETFSSNRVPPEWRE